MPADDGFRLNEHKHGAPALSAAREPGPEQPVNWAQPRQPPLAGEDDKLLAEGKVLQQELLSGSEGVAQQRAEEEKVGDQGRTSTRTEPPKAGPDASAC